MITIRVDEYRDLLKKSIELDMLKEYLRKQYKHDCAVIYSRDFELFEIELPEEE